MSRRGDEVEREVHASLRRTTEPVLPPAGRDTDTLDLFSHLPVARASDPETSHRAAEKVGAAGQRDSQIDVLHTFRTHGPMTDERLIEACQFRGSVASDSRIRTARKELQEQGLVTACGEATTSRGNTARVFRLTAKGINYLRDRGGV